MVCGELGEQTVSDIAPKILELRLSHAPITIFINSTGGDPRAVDYIYHLLSTRAPTGTGGASFFL